MEELEALIILNNISGLGASTLRILIEHFGSALKILDLSGAELSKHQRVKTETAHRIASWEGNNVWKKDLFLVDKHQIDLISYTDSRYPKRLLEISDFPLVLYVKGKLNSDDQHSIAIVGTRMASDYGKTMATEISRSLAQMGFTIVSGLARGIDTVAQESALFTGRTVSIMGSGLMSIYPPENMELAERIIKNGAIVSEFPMESLPDKRHFPQRNRIVSGITMGTVLIEAPIKSGAMNTMLKAQSQGRPIFAVPGRADVESYKGNNSLIKKGEARLVESAQEIAEYFDDLFTNYQGVINNG